MATKLEKPVSREVNISDEFGNEGEVIVTMKTKGIELRRKGTQRRLFIPWQTVTKGSTLPPNAPSRHVLNPLGWLTQK